MAAISYEICFGISIVAKLIATAVVVKSSADTNFYGSIIVARSLSLLNGS